MSASRFQPRRGRESELRISPAEAISHSARDLRLNGRLDGDLFQLFGDTLLSFLSCETEASRVQQERQLHYEGDSRLEDMGIDRTASVQFANEGQCHEDVARHYGPKPKTVIRHANEVLLEKIKAKQQRAADKLWLAQRNFDYVDSTYKDILQEVETMKHMPAKRYLPAGATQHSTKKTAQTGFVNKWKDRFHKAKREREAANLEYERCTMMLNLAIDFTKDDAILYCGSIEEKQHLEHVRKMHIMSANLQTHAKTGAMKEEFRKVEAFAQAKEQVEAAEVDREEFLRKVAPTPAGFVRVPSAKTEGAAPPSSSEKQPGVSPSAPTTPAAATSPKRISATSPKRIP